MKKKLESLFKGSLNSASNLNVQKKSAKAITESVVPSLKLISDIKTIKEVLVTYGKNAGLSAKFGAFDNFRLNLKLPETATVSLFTYYFVNNKKKLVVLIPDHKINPNLKNKSFLLGGKRLKALKSETIKTSCVESVQIGKKEDKSLFIQKVNLPLTVLLIEYEDDSTSKDLNLSDLILKEFSKEYEQEAISDIFTQALITSKVDQFYQPLPIDENFHIVAQYQRKN
jgi:hypothetical protein